MRNSFLLIKNYVMCFLGSLIKNKKSPKYITAVIIFVSFSAIIVGAFTMTAVTSTTMFVQIAANNPGAERLAMYGNCSTALMIMLLLTIMRSAYTNKNTDVVFLLSMPFKKSEIVFSKLFYNYIFDLLTVIGVLLPSYIVYITLVPNLTSAIQTQILLRGVLLVLLLPLLTNALAILISYIIEKIASLFRNKSLIRTLFIVVVCIAYIICYFYLQMLITGASEGSNVDDITNMFNALWPMKILALFSLDGDLPSLLYIVLLTIVPFIGAAWLKTKLLFVDSNNVQVKSKKLKFKQHSATYTLFVKELKYYFSMPIYVLNTILGAVMYVALVVALLVLDVDEIIGYFRTIPSLPSIIMDEPIFTIVVLLSMCITLCVTTNTSISLEGKNFWILKVNPISHRTVFTAKVLLNLALTVIPVVLGGFVLSFKFGFINLWVLILIPLASTILSAIAGIYINLLYPKFDWESEDAVIKRSMSSFLGLFAGTVIIIIPVLMYWSTWYKLIDVYSMSALFIGYLFIVISLLLVLLDTRGKKMFEKL